MKLTPQQHADFDRDGYLFFPGLFTPEETRTLNDAVPELYSRREAYNVREKGSEAVRTNFAAHMVSKPFAKLARHPRMATNVARVANRAEMDGVIADDFAARDIDTLAGQLDQAEIAYGRVNDLHGLEAHPHLALTTVATPGGLAAMPAPAALHVGADIAYGAVPALGADTGRVRIEFLGN